MINGMTGWRQAIGGWRTNFLPEAGHRPQGGDAEVCPTADGARWAWLSDYLREQFCDLAALRPPETASTGADEDVVRYRHPVSGAAWNGRGRQPDWLRQALLVEGWLLVDLRLAARQGAGHAAAVA